MQLTEEILKKMIKEELSQEMKIRYMFEDGIEGAKSAIDLMVSLGMIPEPDSIIEVEELQTITLKYENEEKEQAANFLKNVLRIPKLKGGGWVNRPRFFVFPEDIQIAVPR